MPTLLPDLTLKIMDQTKAPSAAWTRLRALRADEKASASSSNGARTWVAMRVHRNGGSRTTTFGWSSTPGWRSPGSTVRSGPSCQSRPTEATGSANGPLRSRGRLRVVRRGRGHRQRRQRRIAIGEPECPRRGRVWRSLTPRSPRFVSISGARESAECRGGAEVMIVDAPPSADDRRSNLLTGARPCPPGRVLLGSSSLCL